MGVELRPHQVKAIEDIDKYFCEGAENVMSVLSTGAGKTIIKAYYARKCYDNGETCVLIAHRDVLLGQISDALCMYQVPHSFICADKTRRDITNLNLKEHGNHFHDETSRVIVISVATLAARIKKGTVTQEFLDNVKMWLIDECFPAGTLVDGKPVETYQVGDVVTSFNENTLEFTQKKITKIHKNKKHTMLVRVKAGQHHVVETTMGHPFFTRRGWVRAASLTENDEVLSYGDICLQDVQESDSVRRNYRRKKIPVQKKRNHLLFEKVQKSCTKKKYKKTRNRTSLLHLSKTSCDRQLIPEIKSKKCRSSILFERMCSKIREQNKFRNNEPNQQEICVKAHERKQPYEKPRYQIKSERNTEVNWSPSESERRERETTNKSRKNTTSSPSCLRFRKSTHSFNRHILETTRVSTSLQNRLCKPCANDCDRSRWVKSFMFRSKRARHKENSLSQFIRVDSVEIFQSGNSNEHGGGHTDSYVYNFEVEDNHTYVANGFCVHNCHHLTQGSQWGKCVENFPNARGLGVTATPIRGDKKGLGRKFQGYFDVLSCTANMIDLVKSGRLTPMKVYAPTRLDTTGINVTAGGDYNQKKLYERQKKQGGHITGSAIEHYEKFVYGQPTITFAVNIEHGKEVARKFNEAGIPTQFVSSKSAESVRKQAVADLRSGKLWNLVNVDLFGEGFDAPAVAAIFMLRKTESYSLYKQQIGRCLRPSDGKEFGYVFDHVGNVALMLDKFGLLSPYHDPEWTLESYGKSSASDSSDLPKTMDCPLCSYEGPLFDIKDDDGEVIFPGFKQWDGTYKCPDENCGHVFSDEENETVVKKIQEKKGELVELSFEVEQELIKQRDEEIFKPVSELDYGPYARANMSRHVDRQNAITILQHKINKWCNNRYMETGWSSELIRREFEVTFGINIYRSQVLPGPKATKLATKVQNDDIRRSKESGTQRRAV